MLLQMRTFTRSWISYLLLFVLVIAFAIWGINDVFRGVGAQNVAEVGDYEITPAALSRELQLTLRGQREQGQNMTQQEAIDQGIHLRLLENMIGRYALYAYADKIGVGISDRQVGERIREIPRVLNPVTGQFDRASYEGFLRELGYTQPEFERDVRGDMTNQMLMSALVSGTRPPSSYGALALVFETETRIVSIAEANASLVGAIAPPTAAQLETFYQENQDAFRVPEFRGLTFVIARPQDFVARVNVSEDDLNREVEARRATLQEPERRTYVRITAQSEAQANDIVTRLTRGDTPAAVAQALSVPMTRGENDSRDEVPDARVAEAVFSMAAGAAPRVVRGQLAPFVVVRVESITAAPAPDLSALRAQLREQIALEQAAELLHEAVTGFEDARAAGTAITQAAQQHGLPVLSVPAINAQGRDPNGAAVAAVAPLAEPLRAAFETQEGEATDFLPSDVGDVIVSVDRVIPETVRPLEEVRDQLTQAWVARERGRRLREIGQEVIQAVAGGQSFAQAARARSMRIVVTSQSVNREAASNIPARALGPQLFQARVGEVVSDMRVDGNAVIVATVERINRVNPAESPQLVEASRVQTERALAESLVASIQAEVMQRMRPSRNERLLDAQFRGSDDQEQAQ